MPCVIVLGMHRSGTSLVAGILHQLGVHMGDNLIPPRPDNPKGFFEDERVVQINDTILRMCGGTWYRPPSEACLDPDDFPHIGPFIEIMSYIEKRKDAHSLWGMKDPRLCLTLGLWLRELGEARFIVVWRNPLAVARSLEHRDKMDLRYALWLCNEYWRRLLKVIAVMPPEQVLHVQYEHFFDEHREEQIEAIKHFVGKRDASFDEAFIDRALKHW